MPITKLSIEDFFPLAKHTIILDVRSPGEYLQAHIPGAVNFPLFTNEERKEIGTSYKQVSKQNAIKIGLEYFGKNLVKMVEQAELLVKSKSGNSSEVIVHCWRGGMRSAAVAWLLDLYGFKVYLLEGGYKSYRRWTQKQFEKKYQFNILGGYTGSNKTGVLQLLKKEGYPVIDLEALAGHMGSAFGNLQRHEQPSQEQFENDLAFELHQLSAADSSKKIWMEYESQRIGNINIPLNFFNYFSELPYYFLNVPVEQRLKHIVDLYGKASKESLINAIVRITKKLGGLEAKTAINCLMDDDIKGCFTILLHYYDKLYHKNEAKRKQENRQIISIDCETTNASINLQKITEHANSR